jgi:long-chain acyl-CoA synthetase
VSLEEAEALAPTYIYLAPRIMRALIDGHRARYGEAAASVPLCGGRLQWITIGGAMPDEALLAEVEARGIQIVEGYGATEISVLAMTVRGHRRSGWVGKVVPEIDVRIADDGEVMARSQYRMAGYLDNPELTRESFDDAGYYHTGDLGEIDGEGFLRIRGRKRDVFNSSEGSNIYPARIEEMLEGLPSIRQAILVGDGRPYLSALVVPDGDALHGRIASDIAGVNPRLEVFERVRRIAVLDAPFPADVYTPVAQSKVRRDRKKVAERYASVIAKLYDPAATGLDVMLASSTDE